MPRQRSPAPSAVSSSSGASFHTAHESRRSMYPGMQARASDAGESEPSSSSRHDFPGILEEVHNDRDPEPSAPSSKAATSTSRYGSSVTWSDQSQVSLPHYNLDPRDSISNQNSSSSGASGNSRIPCHSPLPRSSKPHTEDEYYDPKYGAWIKTVAPKVRIKHSQSIEVALILIILRIRDKKSVVPQKWTEKIYWPSTLNGLELRQATIMTA